MRRFFTLLVACFVLIQISPFPACASDIDKIISSWTKSQHYRDKFGGEVTISVTYYAAQMVEALVQREAEKNMWTEEEKENYKFELLKTLEYENFVPFRVDINNLGPSMHMAPFGKHITLWVGKNTYQPAKYDPRFNFKLIGQIDGLIYFPRYDEKTGKPLFENVSNMKMIIAGGISAISENKDFQYIWDTARDNPESLTKGKAASKLELERLSKRLEKLNGEKEAILTELARIDEELKKIQSRIDELKAGM